MIAYNLLTPPHPMFYQQFPVAVASVTAITLRPLHRDRWRAMTLIGQLS